ncbi:MAG: glycosyltransferase [bacterium]
MRIGIAAVLGTSGGPRSYARALVAALARTDADHEYWVLTDAPDAVPVHPRIHTVHVPLESRYAQPLWDHVRLPAAVAPLRLDLLHHTKAALPLGIAIASVVSVYDAAPFLHTRTFTRLQALHHRGHIRDAARRADRLITISHEARAELAQALSVDRGRIAVIEPGATGPAREARAACGERARALHPGIRAPFVLALGTIQPRKDLSTVIRAFLRAKERFRFRTGW